MKKQLIAAAVIIVSVFLYVFGPMMNQPKHYRTNAEIGEDIRKMIAEDNKTVIKGNPNEGKYLQFKSQSSCVVAATAMAMSYEQNDRVSYVDYKDDRAIVYGIGGRPLGIISCNKGFLSDLTNL